MQQPVPPVLGTAIGEPVGPARVTPVGEVATAHRVGIAEIDLHRAVAHLGEPRLLEVALLQLPEERPVVVPDHESLGAVEPPPERQRPVERAHGEVTQHPDVVVGTDDPVPDPDDLLVHVGHAGERTVAVPDDVGVAQVEVGGEPETHGDSLSP